MMLPEQSSTTLKAAALVSGVNGGNGAAAAGLVTTESTKISEDVQTSESVSIGVYQWLTLRLPF